MNPAEAPAEPVEAQGWPSTGLAWTALVLVTLATMMNFLDIAVFQLTAELIKRDFALNDFELGLLLGPAGIVFYLLVGIPLARLVDIYPRNVILGIGIIVTSGMTAIGGLVQNFGQFFSSRMFAGVGGSAHAPGTYSILADYFPPKRLPRAFAFLQLGFIMGTGLGAVVGGMMLGYVAGWEPSQLGPLRIFNWQWVFIAVGIPGLLIALALFALPEPPRRGKVTKGKALPVSAVLREIHSRGGVYYPLFIGLAISSLEAGGLGGLARALHDAHLWLDAGADRRVEWDHLLHRLPARRPVRHLAHRIPFEARQGRTGADDRLCLCALHPLLDRLAA